MKYCDCYQLWRQSHFMCELGGMCWCLEVASVNGWALATADQLFVADELHTYSWCLYSCVFVTSWGWYLGAETCKSFIRWLYSLYLIVCFVDEYYRIVEMFAAIEFKIYPPSIMIKMCNSMKIIILLYIDIDVGLSPLGKNKHWRCLKVKSSSQIMLWNIQL